MNDPNDGGLSVARVGNGGALTLLLGAAALAYIVKDHLSTPYDAIFEAVAKRTGVPENLLRAIGRKESSFQPNARNPRTGTYPNGSWDVGLMQINTKTGAAYGYSPVDLLDPAKSVDAAARTLMDMRRSLGTRFSPYTWPAAYNVGPDLEPWLVGQAYASSVLYHWQLYDFGRMLA
jgi:soluble lytic murein transglycosylase-like protein